MPPKSLLNLPVELVCQVLSYLDTYDLLTCSAIQYAIELDKHRTVSVLQPSLSPSFARRLQILREREFAWSRGRWKARHKMNLPFTGSVYDFVSGIYGNGGDDTDGTTTSISFLKLPSAQDQTTGGHIPEPKLWNHSMSNLLIFDFTMDPSQDLLVLLALAPPSSKHIYELHLRTLSTNEPHPQALCPRIPCISGSYQNMQMSDLNPVVTIQVIGELVAVLFKELIVDLGALLSIWSWKLGPKYASTMHRISGIDDFTFLDERTFLVVRPSEKLEVYKFVAPTTRSSVPECIVSFDLPPLSNQYRYWYITLSTNPTPGFVPHFRNSPPTKPTSTDSPNVMGSSSTQLYFPKPQERVLACCLYIFDITQPQDNNVHSFVFFANIQTFLKPVEHWLATMPNRCFDSSLNPGLSRHFLPESGELATSTNASTPRQDGALEAQPAQNSTTSHHPVANPSQHTSTSTDTMSGSFVNGAITANGKLRTFSRAIFQGTAEVEAADDFSVTFPTLSPLSNSASPPSSSTTYTNSLLLSASVMGGCRRTCRIQPGQYPSIPWEVWGPQNTRWFNGNWRTDWQHATYGLRTADSVRIRRKEPNKSEVNATETTDEYHTAGGAPGVELELDEETGNSTNEEDDIANGEPNPLRLLRVRDYNPYSIAIASERLRSSTIQDEKGTSSELAKGNERTISLNSCEPSITPTHGVYKNDIKSWLPYVEMLSEEKLDITDVMLDDRRLLLLKRDNRGLLISIDVLMM
ncbi:hypothetical protein M378DRAFT_187637 [Amanita muscaria Koide BX008]|uniref:F-box domain-containing protein n=1 Tax=Amanita muscaria (strain Koide BX008) TaxID=946122 RepID=A0A0C2SDH7_AMAMK|nr:hypothetical protein M378DRAFT_187637 [Amanita muscaria Koide BX008]